MKEAKTKPVKTGLEQTSELTRLEYNSDETIDINKCLEILSVNTNNLTKCHSNMFAGFGKETKYKYELEIDKVIRYLQKHDNSKEVYIKLERVSYLLVEFAQLYAVSKVGYVNELSNEKPQLSQLDYDIKKAKSLNEYTGKRNISVLFKYKDTFMKDETKYKPIKFARKLSLIIYGYYTSGVELKQWANLISKYDIKKKKIVKDY